MAKLTTKQRDQLQDLRGAADGGLSANLALFIHFACDGIERLQPQPWATRVRLQEIIDTLTNLIDVKVNCDC